MYSSQSLGAHGHGHSHEEEEQEDELLMVWRSCVIVLGAYGFFLFEYILHSWISHYQTTEPSHSGYKDVSSHVATIPAVYCIEGTTAL